MVDELHLTPLVPPPRTHRHRYFGVLAPNSPLRAAVTAMAAPVQPATPEPVQPKRTARYVWAVLIARIYEVFPLLCPKCGGQMCLIAFITEGCRSRRFSITSGSTQIPQTSPWRGGHRCGRTVVMRRWVKRRL